jgi:hypothetical protein
MFHTFCVNRSGFTRPAARIAMAASSDGNAPITIRFVATTDQLNTGIRSSVIPGARLTRAVHSTVAPMSSIPSPASVTPAIQRSTPGPGV